jgi:hypothetical protein
MAGAPYKVYNNIAVSVGQSLIIDPGVQVELQGPYSITVYGSLQAVGTSAMPITFNRNDTSGWSLDTTGSYIYTGGWRGIAFYNYTSSAADISELRYCNISHVKYGEVTIARNMHISYCDFSVNRGLEITLFGASTPGVYEFDNNSLHENRTGYVRRLISIGDAPADWFIHDNNIYDNGLEQSGSLISIANSSVLLLRNNIYHNGHSLPLNSYYDSHVISIGTFSSMSAKPANVVMSQNRIYDNITENAAAVMASYSIVDMHRNYICNNQHVFDPFCAHAFGGGGIFLVGSGDFGDIFSSPRAVYSVRNNLIANNYSPLYGGGIALYDTKALIANNTIANNTAWRGGGIDMFLADTVTVCIKNNIISGNANEADTSIKGNTHLTTLKEANIRFDHNWVSQPFHKEIVVTTTVGGRINYVTDTASNIIGGNPGMAAPTLTADVAESALMANFSLLSMSVCIDAGNDSAVVPGGTDYAGNMRISGAAVDIGAYEYGATLAGATVAQPVDSIFNKCCTVPFRYAAPVNMVSEAQGLKMGVYPNPAVNSVFVTSDRPAGIIQLRDLAGRVVRQSAVVSTLTAFDTQSLPRGFYLAVWNNGSSEKVVEKVILE